MVIAIQKWGNSQGIRLPKHLLDSVNWKESDKLNVKAEKGKIIIEKAEKPKRKNIKELFADFDGQYTPIEMDWGEPRGEEIW